MKKLILGMVSVTMLSISALTITCPVDITNDTQKDVYIKTNDTQTPSLNLKPGQMGSFGNHAGHVEFTIQEQDAAGNYSPVLSVRQLECAKRLVVVSVSSIKNHKYKDGQAIHPAKFEILRLDKQNSSMSGN